MTVTAPQIDLLMEILTANGFTVDVNLRHNASLLAAQIAIEHHASKNEWERQFARHLQCLIAHSDEESFRYEKSILQWCASTLSFTQNAPSYTKSRAGVTARIGLWWRQSALPIFKQQWRLLILLFLLTLAAGLYIVNKRPPSTPVMPVVPEIVATQAKITSQLKIVAKDQILSRIIEASIEMDRAPTLRELHRAGSFSGYELKRVQELSGLPTDQPLAMDDKAIAESVFAVALRLSSSDGKGYVLPKAETTILFPGPTEKRDRVPPLKSNQTYGISRYLSSSGAPIAEIFYAERILYPDHFWNMFFSVDEANVFHTVFMRPQPSAFFYTKTDAMLRAREVRYGSQVSSALPPLPVNQSRTSTGRIVLASRLRSYSAWSHAKGQPIVVTDAPWLPVRRAAPPFGGILPHMHWFIFGLAIVLGLVGWVWRAIRLQGWLDRNRDSNGKVLDLSGQAQAPLDVAFPRSQLLARALLHPVERSQTLDAKRSIVATVRAGGFFTPRWKARRATPSTLFLYEQRALDDHSAARAKSWISLFKSENVPLEAYAYDGAPDVLHPLGGGAPIQFEQFATRNQGDRLLLAGDAAELKAPGAKQLGKWSQALLAFPDRALLTGVPTDLWGPDEVALQTRSGLDVHPFTYDGISAALSGFQNTDSAHHQKWQKFTSNYPWTWPKSLSQNTSQWLSDALPTPPEVQKLVGELSGWLGLQGMRWLQACAVYPILNWELTLELGTRLLEGGKPLLDEDRLLRLSELPWMKEGCLPDWLRGALIARISDADRALIVNFLRELVTGLQDGGLDNKLKLGFAARFGRNAAADERFVSFVSRAPKGADKEAIEATRTLARLVRPSLLSRLLDASALTYLLGGCALAITAWLITPRFGFYGEANEFWWVPLALALFLCFIFVTVRLALSSAQWQKIQLKKKRDTQTFHPFPSETSPNANSNKVAQDNNEGSSELAKNARKAKSIAEAKFDVFLSWSKPDSQLAQLIRQKCTDRGLSVWSDTEILPSSNWRTQIERQLSDCNLVIALITKNSLRSEWVRTEASYAQKEGKLLAIVENQSMEIPIGIRDAFPIYLDWDLDSSGKIKSVLPDDFLTRAFEIIDSNKVAKLAASNTGEHQ